MDDQCSLPSNFTRLLEPTLTITKVAKRRFSYHAPLYWNRLPISIRNIKDTTAFKSSSYCNIRSENGSINTDLLLEVTTKSWKGHINLLIAQLKHYWNS